MRRALAVLVAVLLGLTALVGCARTVDGEPVPVGAAGQSGSSDIDTDQFDKLLLECDVLPDAMIADVVAGGGFAERSFSGAICRWLVSGATDVVSVTFNWFEWGNVNLEKETAKKLGFQTENIKVASQSAFTQRSPDRPGVCGVTARAPSRGIFTWFVEPRSAPAGDPCEAPIKLMELLLQGGQ
ncbi:DUF3558 domain-containing protein [Gordonia alkanivorans]|uniref:DUF3558 domain-containing protein n=1 Tax=Gordonia alkanivorans TaxID=84096 RepID=UPI000FDD8259|nr:DUF3558 domain-containing protein [Gordonia alkanivorans]AZZ81103.1 DUF3558 domain-containing protein [Gordonia alkanivorans]